MGAANAIMIAAKQRKAPKGASHDIMSASEQEQAKKIKRNEGRNMAKVCVFTADGFEEIEGLTVVDLLRRAGIQVLMVSISDGLAVKGSHNIELKADIFFDDVDYEDVDMLVLPGGMPGTLHLGEHEGLCTLLQEFYKKGKQVAAICAAPSVLGKLGILEGRKAVCYPGFEEKLTGASVEYGEVAHDGNVTTSRGLGTAIPFSLELISLLLGEEKAEEIKKSVIYKQ